MTMACRRRDFEAVDGGDVRMVQRREQPSLALEARDAVRIVATTPPAAP